MLTWDKLFRVLSKQFGEDIAQQVILNYLKNYREIQHTLRYFRVAAKHARQQIARQEACRRAKAADYPWPEREVQPSQIARLLLLEAWNNAPEPVKRIVFEGGYGESKNTSRTLVFRFRKFYRSM